MRPCRQAGTVLPIVVALVAVAILGGCGTGAGTPSGDISPTLPPASVPLPPASGPSAQPPSAQPPSPPPSAAAGSSAWHVTLEIDEGTPLDLAVQGDRLFLAAADGILVSGSPGEWGPLVPPEDVAWVTRVAAGPGAVVATGGRIPDDPKARELGEHPGAAWWLDDDRWVHAQISAPLPHILVTDVAWDGSRFLAVGMAGCREDWNLARVEPRARLVAASSAGPATLSCPGREGTLPMRWVSPDGLQWTADPDRADQVGGISSIAAGPRGVAAAGALDGRPAAWWLDASAEWQSAALPATGAGSAYAVGFAGDAMVVIGSDEAGAAAWRSTDGRDWQRFPRAVPSASLTQVPGGLASIGSEPGMDEVPGATVIAITTDGLAWTRLPEDPALDGLGPTSMAVAGARVVLAGEAGMVLEADLSAIGLAGS